MDLTRIAWLFALGAAPLAHAQDAEGVEAADAGQPVLTPPALMYAPEPHIPAAAGASGGAVVLRVTVDPQGAVTNADLVERAGPELDDEAIRLAFEHRFEPARRNGEPVLARILLRIEFLPPTPPAPLPEPTPPPLVLEVPPPVPNVPPQAERTAIEITVPGHTEAERMRRSAEAVHVVETEQAKRQTADLGEVLARTQGVGVQRAGGIGSDTRFSLNGLTDDQIRFFLDGVPLEFTGYPFGISNVPVNLVERVEIYRGVVPIRFGADALGGAVNLVSDRAIRGTHASGSYQLGSFGTHLLTLSARHLDESSGWFTRVNAFLDRADNDYPMDIEVPDNRGRPISARVYRFHDGYAAQGANLETGVVDQAWADRLLVRGFATHYDKELQHNLVMTFNPYGDVEYGELTAGGTVRYEHELAHGVSVNAVAGYAYGHLRYVDLGECIYDWFGQCVNERRQPGERTGRGTDQRFDEHSGYGRATVEWRLHPQHAFRLSLSPTYIERIGEERRRTNPDARDPLSAQRQLFTLVSGLEYALDLFGERLENVLFVKDYLQQLRSEDPLSSGRFRQSDRDTHRVGVGNALRFAFADWVYTKLSYEWSTRLPRPDEIFGNAFPVEPNLELEPELSHNLNLGVTVDTPLARAGRLRSDVNGFLRSADQLIVLVGDDQNASYQNVYSARSVGVELAAGWTSPGEYLTLDGNFTYVDFRNTSNEGAFSRNEGERIPNRPYLFGNASARAQLREIASERDELTLVWTSRYVHEFFRGWEDLGIDKLTVDAQLLHSIALIYAVANHPAELSFTIEVQNLTDAEAFDFFGVLRPGRAAYFKLTASL